MSQLNPSARSKTYGIIANKPFDVYKYMQVDHALGLTASRIDYRPEREVATISSLSGIEIIVEEVQRQQVDGLLDGRTRTYAKFTMLVGIYNPATAEDLDEVGVRLGQLGYTYFEIDEIYYDATSYRAAIGAGEGNPGAYGDFILGFKTSFLAGQAKYNGEFNDILNLKGLNVPTKAELKSGGTIFLPDDLDVTKNYWMSTTDPTSAGGATIISQGNGYYLYERPARVTVGDVYLDNIEAGCARGCRVFHDFSLLDLHERKTITLPVMLQDELLCRHLIEDASAYFHSLDLTLPQIQEKFAFYKDALDATAGNSVELARAILQTLSTATATGATFNIVPDEGIPGSTNGTSAFWGQYFYPGDAPYDEYKLVHFRSSHAFVFWFEDLASMLAFKGNNPYVVISGGTTKDGTYVLTTLTYQNNGAFQLIYSPAMQGGIRLWNREIMLLAQQEPPQFPAFMSINADGTAPSTAYNETDMVNHLISEIDLHLQKFPR